MKVFNGTTWVEVATGGGGDIPIASSTVLGKVKVGTGLSITSEGLLSLAKSISDSPTSSAIGTSSNLVTERDIYYGLPRINGSHNYTSSNEYFSPTGYGSKGQVFMSNATATPNWATIVESLASSSGYLYFPQHSIRLKWGYATPSSGKITITFPSAFPSACVCVLGINGAATATNTTTCLKVNAHSRTGFTGYCTYATASGAGWATEKFLWFAIGY